MHRAQWPLSFVFHAECTAHVPSWLPRSPSCELASDCLVAHLLPRQWHSLAACPRHVCLRAGPLLSSGLAMFVARQPIAEVVARPRDNLALSLTARQPRPLGEVVARYRATTSPLIRGGPHSLSFDRATTSPLRGGCRADRATTWLFFLPRDNLAP